MKRLISMLICASLLVPFCGMLSYAVPFTQEIEPQTVEALRFPEDTPELDDVLNSSVQFFSNPNCTFKFVNCLTAAQRGVYNSIVEQKGGILSGGVVSVFISGSSDFMEIIRGAVSAAMDDYPEFFWLGGFSVNGQQTATGYDLKVTFTLDTGSYDSWETVKECYYELLTAVESFEVKGNNRYAKLKSIHDSICEMTIYTLNVPMAHHPTGVFLKGQAVCEGYAEAFKLLCDRENIPCIIVVGTGNGGGHEWNYVQMEDGKWYGMDVTWDDQTESEQLSRINYDYFLVGSESISIGKKKFGDGTDSDGNHINSGKHFPKSSFALTYPAITQQSYTGVIPMWSSDASFDNEKGFMFIPKGVVANQQILCTYGMWAGNAPSTNKATVTGITTGGTVSITSPVSKTYTIVRMGDVDKNNKVNDADYNELRDIVQCKKPKYTDKAQLAAADINGDGVIDVFDVIELDLYCNT